MSICLRLSLVFAAFCLGGGLAAGAEPVNCTVILEARSGNVLLREGTCDQRFAPFSTFKLPLAIIGYDAGILTDDVTPRWEWHAGLTAPQRDQKPVDPTIWERDSVLWYSREITSRLGGETFGRYVGGLGYGNGNVAGIAGRDNGLTHSWLGASLAISPDEQVAFVRRLLLGALPVSATAHARAASILPDFEAGGWTVSGKTGSGWVSDARGEYFRDQPLGWFVGWAQRGAEVVVFARLRVDDMRSPDSLGPIVRESVLADLPTFLP